MTTEDFFLTYLDQGYGLSLEQSLFLKNALLQSFPHDETGQILWQQRPLAKKWYLPRRGRSGTAQILVELPVEGGVDGYLIRSDQQIVLFFKVREIFAHIHKFLQPETSLIVVHRSGRWIMEFSPDGYLHFDFSIPDEKEFSGLFGSCPVN